VALTLDLASVPHFIWEKIGSWCTANAVNEVDIVIARGPDNTPSQLSDCTVGIHRQAPGMESWERLPRLRAIRTHQQQRIIAREGTKPEVVVAVDLDEYLLPSADQIRISVETVRSSHWDVLAANGWIHLGDRKGMYDFFALVLNDRSYWGPHLYENMNEAMDIFEDVAGSDEPYEVRSAFGGLGVFKFRGVWDGGSSHCDYNAVAPDDFRVWGCGNVGCDEWCEHVGFHECLRAANSGLRVGISGRLPVHWSSDYDSNNDRRALHGQTSKNGHEGALMNYTAGTAGTVQAAPIPRL